MSKVYVGALEAQVNPFRALSFGGGLPVSLNTSVAKDQIEQIPRFFEQAALGVTEDPRQIDVLVNFVATLKNYAHSSDGNERPRFLAGVLSRCHKVAMGASKDHADVGHVAKAIERIAEGCSIELRRAPEAGLQLVA